MNQKLLNNKIQEFNGNFKTPKMKEDGSNAFDFFCADVVGNRRFAQNFGGYPRSEIAEINAAANLELQKSLLSQLEDFSNRPNVNAGLSDVEIALGHRSKYQQAPSEMQSWLESQLQIRDAKRAAAIAKVQAAQAAAKKSAKTPDKVIETQPE